MVDAGDTEKVQLVLAGADITSSTSAAIYALEADKVFITSAENTENTLTNGGEYIAIDDNNIDAVIFAKTDLTLNGSGSLTINAQGRSWRRIQGRPAHYRWKLYHHLRQPRPVRQRLCRHCRRCFDHYLW